MEDTAKDVVWPVDICIVCEEAVTLFNGRGYMSMEDGEYVHHVDNSRERTCFEKLLDAWAELWVDCHPESSYLVSGRPWIPGRSKAANGCHGTLNRRTVDEVPK